MWRYLRVPIRRGWIAEAKERGARLGVLKNSITSGASNIYGMLGERVVAHLTGGELVDTRDYDVLSETGAKLEVKTKKCLHPPRAHFECSCARFNTHQRCDAYVFVRILRDCSVAFVCGFLPKQIFLRDAHELKKGDYDERNKYYVKADCFNVTMTQLWDANKLRDWRADDTSLDKKREGRSGSSARFYTRDAGAV